MTRKWVILLGVKPGHFKFIIAELRALADLFSIPASHFSDEAADYARIHYRFNFTEDDCINERKLRDLCSRSVSVQALYELWDEAESYEKLHENLTQSDPTYREKYYDSTFAFGIETINRKKMSMPERLAKFESFTQCLPMSGKINLSAPECLIVLIENYNNTVNNKPNNKPKSDADLINVSITRFLCNGQRALVNKYAVTNRRVVGNTSMDAELSLFMTNIAQVKPGSFVFDPFVGTGSMLLTSAHFGAHVLGSDISWNIMMARGKSARVGQGMREANETLYGALEQFSLQHKFIDGLIVDNNVNPWRQSSDGWFDAIITDPPYGVREKAEKVGSSKKFVDWIDFDNHFPDKIAYSLADVFSDMMKFSYNHLRLDGNLVFWYPVAKVELQKYGSKLYPNHPAFKLICDCEQVLNRRTSRILLSYKKIKDLGRQVDCSDGSSVDGEVHALHNGFREIYFQPTPPGTQHVKWKDKPETVKNNLKLEMVVLRRRQVACIRALLVMGVTAGFMIFVYFYMENNDELQRKMELVIKDINDDTDKALVAIQELEGHLEDLDIQPMPEAQYLVYNRVPKCASMSMTTLSYKLGARNNFKVESPYEAGERPDKSRSEQLEFVDYLKNQEPPYMYIRHQYYIDFSDLNENVPAAYINMIRDPIARFESFYYFSRFGNKKGGGGNARMTEEIRAETVDECVEKRRKECTQPVWQVVPYLCGMGKECLQRSSRAVQIAQENVEENYLFVGVLEEMPKSLKILEQLLPHFFGGATELSEENASREMRDQTITLNKKPASPETRRFLRENTSIGLEYKLYDFVVEHLKRIAKKLDIKD